MRLCILNGLHGGILHFRLKLQGKTEHF